MSQASITGSLLDPETRRCPYDFYKEARETAPVYFVPEGKFYFVSCHNLIVDVLQNYELFSNQFPPGQTSFVNYCPEADQVLAEKGYGRRVKNVVFNDPPDHTKWRRLVTDAFRPPAIRAMEPKIRAILGNLLDTIEDDETCDVVQAVFVPLPMYVIADRMGVDRDHYLDFKRWSMAANYTLQPPLSKEALIRGAETIAEMQHYLVDMMNKRRQEPRDDLITELLDAKLGGERPLTDKEILSLLETLLVAGNETTTNAMGNGLLLLAKNSELQTALRENPDKIPKFVEEVLRLESSVTGVFRCATADTELGGVPIPKGAMVLLSIASGNRDDVHFAEAEKLDLDRSNIRSHVGFGYGIHTCVGNQLARLELICFYQVFLERFSQFTLAIPEEKIKYQELMGLRGLAELPLKLRRAA